MLVGRGYRGGEGHQSEPSGKVPVEEEAHNRVDAGPEQTSATRRLSGRPGDLCQAIPRPRGHWPQHRAPRAAGRAV